MELRTRCRLIPALFAFTFCAVPAVAQDTPEPPINAGNPTPASEDIPPVAQAPGGQPEFPPGNPGQNRQFAPVGQPFYGQQTGRMFNPMMPQSPELAKKMRAIMGLREMWSLRLTAKDIAAILPPLKELAQAERNLQNRSEQILEDERKALLSADPEGDPPDGNGDLLQRENDLYRIKSDDVWRAIDKSLGKTKAAGLRRLVGMGGQWQSLVPPGSGRPDASGFSPAFGGGGLPGSGAPAGLSGGRGGALPAGGQPPSGGNVSGQGLAAPADRSGGQSSPPTNVFPIRPAPNRQGDLQGRDVVPGSGGDGQFGGAVRGSSPFAGIPFMERLFTNEYKPQVMSSVRLSLTELVALLSDKQAAMRK